MISTVKVTGYAYHQNGEPAANAKGVAILSQYEIDNGVVVPHQVVFRLDDSGYFEIDLWPNERGTGNSSYEVTIYLKSPEPFEALIYVPEVDHDVRFKDILLQSPLPPVSEAEQILQDVLVSSSESKVAAAASKVSASESADSAEASRVSMEASQVSAAASLSSANAAAVSASEASLSATAAKDSEDFVTANTETAIIKAGEASQSATQAATSETNTKASETAAASSETQAQKSAQAAATSAQESADSAANSAEAAMVSLNSADISQASANAAAISASESLTSETNASISETNAANSATAANASADTALSAATSASNSASAASISEIKAATSAFEAEGYAERAETDANTATIKAAEASDYAANSLNSADQSSASAAASAQSAQDSSDSADASATSAQESKLSAEASETSNQSAIAQATIATTQATIATEAKDEVIVMRDEVISLEQASEDSAELSKNWAINMSGLVDGEDYSSKYYANKSEESRQASKDASDIASQQASAASTSAAESQQSADLSQDWAVKLGSTVDGDEYSAKHYAQIAVQESQSALDSKNAAKQSADDSKAFSITSTEQATISTSKAGEASTSASNALASEQNAKTSEINAAISENNAETSANNAKDSEDSAMTSATNALNSANLSATKASEASGHAINAETSATTAADKADEAGGFADNAKASATTATNAASAASVSANNAAASASVASSKASDASAFATTASDEATIATDKAGEASASATAAANSASDAASSKSQAESFAYDAESSASSAESAKDDAHSYLNKAKDWASKLDTPVEGDEYSAKHWAKYAETMSAVNFATETSTGVSRFGTQEEVIAGVLDNVGVSPKRLKEVSDTKVNISLIGVPAGVTPLGQDGKIPSSYLPASVEQILEFESLSNFPENGESDKIYVALDTNRVYRWGGSQYAEIASSPGSTDEVAEGSVNLYFTNSRAANASPVQSVSGRKGDVVLTKSDVGLGNVNNTSDANKPISTAVQSALNTKANDDDSRLTNSREWTASTVSQAEAEAGTATTRRAWTAQRVRQAINSWWNGSTSKTKLDGIATGATKNATDAQLRDRATHTGVQPISSISGLQTELDKIADTAYVDTQLNGKVDKETGKSLILTTDIQKLSGIEAGAQKNTVTSVAGKTGAVTLTVEDVSGALNSANNLLDLEDPIVAKTNLGLCNVDNTSDIDKPISATTQAAIDTINTALDTKAISARQIIAGNGLTGGGTLASNRTLTLGTPNEVSTTSTSSVTASSHTHALSAGVKASLAKADSAIQASDLGSAASRNVGTGTGNVMEVGAFGLGGQSSLISDTKANSFSNNGRNEFFYVDANTANKPSGLTYGQGISINYGSNSYTSELVLGYRNSDGIHWRGGYSETNDWQEIYHTGNFNPDSKANTSTQVIAGTGLTGGGTLAANRTLNVAYGTTAGTAAQGNDSRLSNSREWTASVVTQAEAEAGTATTARKWTAQRVAQAISALGLKIGTTATTAKAGNWMPTWANVTGKPTTFTPSAHTHSLSEVTDAGNLATLSTNDSTANFLRGDGTWVTPPNTTYSEISTAEIDTGTSSTRRAISGRRLKYALDKKSDTGHGHVIGDVTGLQAALDSKTNTSTQVIAGSGLLGGGTLAADRTLSVSFGTTSGTAAQGNDSRIVNAVPSSRSIIAGDGLTGGGSLVSNRTITLGTPGTVTGSSTNAVTSTGHTHAISVTKDDVGLGNVLNVASYSKTESDARYHTQSTADSRYAYKAGTSSQDFSAKDATVSKLKFGTDAEIVYNAESKTIDFIFLEEE